MGERLSEEVRVSQRKAIEEEVRKQAIEKKAEQAAEAEELAAAKQAEERRIAAAKNAEKEAVKPTTEEVQEELQAPAKPVLKPVLSDDNANGITDSAERLFFGDEATAEAETNKPKLQANGQQSAAPKKQVSFGGAQTFITERFPHESMPAGWSQIKNKQPSGILVTCYRHEDGRVQLEYPSKDIIQIVGNRPPYERDVGMHLQKNGPQKKAPLSVCQQGPAAVLKWLKSNPRC